MTVYAGTSGWSYKEWSPDFYPPGLPQRRWLEHYAHTLGACEINATFYRRTPVETYAKWSAAAPSSFRFAIKAHRALTHSKEIALRGPQGQLLDDFLASASTLGAKLGPILFQIPRHRVRDDDLLKDLMAAVAGRVVFALDLIHDSWRGDDIAHKVARAGGTVCLTEAAGKVPLSLPPGPMAYVRLRWPHYSPEQRNAWNELLQREAQTRDVYIFTKHEGVSASDASGGIGLARWLAEQVRTRPVPQGTP